MSTTATTYSETPFKHIRSRISIHATSAPSDTCRKASTAWRQSSRCVRPTVATSLTIAT
ncbi:MAG TPA: hypothetical protein VG097_03490 [Gemmata sp.]|nr:hypothetical protein [Gemmata sp.]